MKALLLKDLYNIGHNARSMLVVLLFLAIAIVPTSGPVAYMVMCGVLCAMMIVTTFTFDEASGWTAYALILPVRRSRLVLAKYAALAVFCTVGVLFGLAAGSLGDYLTSDGSTMSYRTRIRTPSYAHLQQIPAAIRGSLVSDLIVYLGSIDFVMSDVDR